MLGVPTPEAAAGAGHGHRADLVAVQVDGDVVAARQAADVGLKGAPAAGRTGPCPARIACGDGNRGKRELA